MVCVGPRRYGRLLVCVAATPVSAELQEPCGLLALAGCNRLRLHSDKEPSSAGPTARWKPCGVVLLRCHRASAGVTVVSPLEGFPVRRLSRLSACRLDFSGHPASRLKPSRRLSVKARAIGLNRRLSVSGSARRVARSKGGLRYFCIRPGTAAAPLSGGVYGKKFSAPSQVPLRYL
jgi:hypothetical protein